MAPVEYLLKNGEEKLLHRCLVCGYEKLNRLDKADNRELLLKIIATLK